MSENGTVRLNLGEAGRVVLQVFMTHHRFRGRLCMLNLEALHCLR